MKYAFIERHRRDWPVSIQCSVLDVSARGFHQYLRRTKIPGKDVGRVSDMALLTHIKAIHAETRGAYGWPRIWRELRHRGFRVGKERVRRMMHDNAIRARSKRKYKATTDSNHGLPVSDNLLNRNFQPERPDLVWANDITYIATQEGWLYLAVVIDLFSRQVVPLRQDGCRPDRLQRWQAGDGLEAGDRRPSAERPRPAHALSDEERARVLAVANEPRFAALPPARIVPMLADEGTYLASESSFRRVLRDHGQSRHRGRAKAPQASRPPTTHVARATGEVWCWDMTFLPAETKGRWFFLYLILDLYSRKVVGWEVHDTDEANHAAHMVRRTALAEAVDVMAARPVLHGDNGATLKATTVLAMLHWLGITPSYSRPRVSDDNPFVEALFKTAKYRSEFPAHGFAGLDEARAWAKAFVGWYNDEHRHGGIRYVTPAQRHAGRDRQILAARHDLYRRAKERNPSRWSGRTRDWSPIGAVTLNPERDAAITAPPRAEQKTGAAA